MDSDVKWFMDMLTRQINGGAQSLVNLTTTDKSSVVAAINEVQAQVAAIPSGTGLPWIVLTEAAFLAIPTPDPNTIYDVTP